MASKARAKASGRAGRRELVLDGGRKAKVRKPSERSWTKSKKTEFLEVLAETCNVSEACRQAGGSTAAAYKLRQKDAAFRAAWREAIAIAYRRLELVLLERAFNGTDKIVTRKDGSEERVREYPNSIAVQLLKMHQATAEAADHHHSPQHIEEMREKLRRKLARLRQRMIDEGSIKP